MLHQHYVNYICISMYRCCFTYYTKNAASRTIRVKKYPLLLRRVLGAKPLSGLAHIEPKAFGQVDSLSANPSWISECDACQTIMCQFLSLSAQYYTVDNSSKIALSQMSQSQCLCIRNVNNLHWVSNDTRAIILLFVRQTQMLHQITHLLEGILLDALRLLRVADFHK